MHSTDYNYPELPDRALRQHFIDPTNPASAQSDFFNSSVQFQSWRTGLHGINKALGRMQRESPPPTGVDTAGNPVVVVELRGAGRG